MMPGLVGWLMLWDCTCQAVKQNLPYMHVNVVLNIGVGETCKTCATRKFDGRVRFWGTFEALGSNELVGQDPKGDIQSSFFIRLRRRLSEP
jgi:hypothetical protein